MVGGDDIAQGFHSFIAVICVAASCGHVAISMLLLVVKVITNYCQHLYEQRYAGEGGGIHFMEEWK